MSKLICIVVATYLAQKTMPTVNAANSEQDHSVEKDAGKMLVKPLTKFSAEIFKALGKDNENVMISSISVHSALNLVLLGYPDESKARKELTDALGYNHVDTNEALQSYAQLIKQYRNITAEAEKAHAEAAKSKHDNFGRPPMMPSLDIWTMALTKNLALKQSYLDATQKYLNSSARSIGGPGAQDSDKAKASIVQEVNQWGKKAGYDSELLNKQQLDENFDLLLISAARLEAYWFKKFSESSGSDEIVFYNNGDPDSPVKNKKRLGCGDFQGRFVEFTTNASSEQKGRTDKFKEEIDVKQYDELAGLEFRAIAIPMNGHIDYVIIEPLQLGKSKLAELEKGLLADEKLSQVMSLLDTPAASNEYQYMTMPAFKFESDLKLVETLKKMGIRNMFSRKSDITGIDSAGRPAMATDVQHKTVIDVNKNGIKAAGYTQIAMMLLSYNHPVNPLRIHVKHPFLFVIRHNKVPLFIGHLVKLPQKPECKASLQTE